MLGGSWCSQDSPCGSECCCRSLDPRVAHKRSLLVPLQQHLQVLLAKQCCCPREGSHLLQEQLCGHL